MDTTLTTHLTRLLLHAARNRRVLPYTRFHSIFPHTIPLAARYAALESVLQHLSDSQQADYGVLLARDNGLPGPEFFQRFRKHRLDEYTAVAGDPRYHNATMKQQRLIVDTERARVYAHVATHFPTPETQRDAPEIRCAGSKAAATTPAVHIAVCFAAVLLLGISTTDTHAHRASAPRIEGNQLASRYSHDTDVISSMSAIACSPVFNPFP
ncbi:hypothetical protein P3T23_007255 [Paraburkholderia sp. GAS448]|uniref:hypothetical protein n=1 Tax=Paraburkholderia sp. GAS448 TaxID=3035136 RepID=UPI003D21D5AE